MAQHHKIYIFFFIPTILPFRLLTTPLRSVVHYVVCGATRLGYVHTFLYSNDEIL